MGEQGDAPHQEETSFQAGEASATAFHERSESEAVSIWVAGLKLMLRSMDKLTGPVTRQEEWAVTGIMLGAFQSLKCAYDLALRGYYPQSLNLLRSPVEYWLAYWYLRSYPERHEEFTASGGNTRNFNEMLQAIESKQGAPPDTVVRAWLKQLHVYSHVDEASVRLMLPYDGSNEFAFGPQEYGPRFRYCTAQAVLIIAAWLEAIDNFSQLLGKDPVERQQYESRVEAWITAGPEPTP